MALVMVSAPGVPVMFAVGSMAITLAVLVLAAHLGAYRPKAKRVMAAALVALALAFVTVRASEDDDFMMQDPCKKYTASDWQWWAAGCMLP